MNALIKKQGKRTTRFIAAAGVFLLFAAAGRAFEATPSSGTKTVRSFHSGGHLLSFRDGGLIVASADHALEMAWIEGRSSTLQADPGPADELGRVVYQDLWKDVQAVFERGSGILKSSYHVAAEAGAEAVGRIRLRYNRPVRIAADGGLIIEFETGAMKESAPVAWQETDQGRTPVAASFRLVGENEVGFAVGAYDPGVALVIDPELTWTTFIGGSGSDQCRSLVVDGNGNIFIAGYSGATWGSPVRAYYGSGYDGFVAKLDSSGNLVWNTFLGGSGNDSGYSVFVDGSGYVYVTGESSATWGSPIRSYSYSQDAFVAKLDAGGALVWNAFLGSTNTDYGYAVAADGAGNVYVGGQSYGTWGSPIRAYTAACDGFVAKLDSTGTLIWNTFLGGSGDDFIHYGLVLDAAGNPYVTGTSASVWGTPVRAYSASDDAFVARLDTAGNLVWNTFLGGSGSEYGMDIALDSAGNSYVCGTGDSDWGSPIRAYSADADAFAAKIDAAGNLVWNTFLGGSAIDYGFSVALDGNGNVYLGGHSAASWGSPERAYTSGYDAFAAKLDPGGALIWSTFLGGSGDDYGYGLAVDGLGNAFLGGYSSAAWGSPIRAYTSGNDAFVAKISGSMNIIQLTSFRAARDGDRVDVTWGTAYENNCAGFHLWRSETLGGAFTLITSALIPARGGLTSGVQYSYQDSNVLSGHVYFYRLEAFDLSGNSDLFGPVASWSAGDVVVLTAPRDGGVQARRGLPLFSWSAGNFIKFRVELAPAASFLKDVVVWPFTASGQPQASEDDLWISGTSFRPSAAEWQAVWPYGKWAQVYWRVRARDALGRETVSGVFSFRMI
jgi:hypothetical protein